MDEICPVFLAYVVVPGGQGRVFLESFFPFPAFFLLPLQAIHKGDNDLSREGVHELWCGSKTWFLFDADPGYQNYVNPDADPHPKHYGLLHIYDTWVLMYSVHITQGRW